MWVWLVLLAGGAVVISLLPLSPSVTLLLIFEVAVIKALLVVMYFMHVKFERPFIYCLIIVPLVFFGILMLVLFPDIALHGAPTAYQSTGH